MFYQEILSQYEMKSLFLQLAWQCTKPCHTKKAEVTELQWCADWPNNLSDVLNVKLNLNWQIATFLLFIHKKVPSKSMYNNI